jgi:hypothetical protein
MARQQQQMCAVSVGFDHFLLPMNLGLKLVDIMQKAVLIEPVYDGSKKKWELNSRASQADLKLSLVRPEEIRVKDNAASNGALMLAQGER